MDGIGTCLVTGGMGFIGSHLLTAVAEEYGRVIVADALLPSVHDFLPQLPQGVLSVVGDISEPRVWGDIDNALPSNAGHIDVVHLASDTSTGRSLLQPSVTVKANVLGTALLCEFLASRRSQIRAVVLASSRAVYGEGQWLGAGGHLIQPQQRNEPALRAGRWIPVDGEAEGVSPLPHSAGATPERPVNIYGVSKLSQEQVLGVWGRSLGIPVSVLRLQNVFGEGQSLRNSYAGVVAAFVATALRGQPPNVFEDGGILRDFIHVGDVVRAICASLMDGETCSLVDVGTGRGTTLLDLATLIADLAGSPKPVVSGNFRLGDVRAAFASHGSLHPSLIASPPIDLKTGLQATLEWAAGSPALARRKESFT